MSTKTLVVVESPAKAKTLSRYLADGYEIAASVGHVRDLPKTKLGVDIDNGFEPSYEVAEGKENVVRDLRGRAKGASTIMLATDPDREGEAIAFHVAWLLGYDERPSLFRRVRFREVTKSAVETAVRQPSEIDFNRVNAQQARRVLDRLVGYKVSNKLPRGQSAGRVQTVALRLVCEREDEIRAFVKEEYWSITAHLRAEGKAFAAKLHRIDRMKVGLPNETAAKAVVADLPHKELKVARLQRKQKRQNAPAPFTTSTLQQQAAKRFRLPVKRTMSIAQRLYEGLEVGKRGRIGLITYMRTDSTRVSAGAARDARRWIEKAFGESYLPSGPRLYGGKKSASAQDAHEAIRPARVEIAPEEARRYLDAEHARLYEMIWKRFVASQMLPAIHDTTSAEFDVTDAKRRYLFRASGSVLRFDGYTRLYVDRTEKGDPPALDKGQVLPPLEEGSLAELTRLEPRQHYTQPPLRYSEARLVKEMEEKGIGRPSTYAQILTRIVDAGYVVLRKRLFEPTPEGQALAKLLVTVLPDTFDVEFTRRMESRLDRIENGEEDWTKVLADFYPPFSERLEAGVALGRHPDDDRAIVLRAGRFGAYLELAPTAEEEARTISVPPGVDPSTLDSRVAARLLELPRELGPDPQTGEMVEANAGRRGPFVKRGKAYADLGSIDEVWTVTKDEALSKIREREDRVLGVHPDTGAAIVMKVGPWGPYLEMTEQGGKKPKRQAIPDDADPNGVDLDLARRLLELPRSLGAHPASGRPVEAGVWRGRAAVRSERTYVDLPDLDSVWSTSLEEAATLVEQVRRARTSRRTTGKPLKELGLHPDSGRTVVVLDGRWGPYVTDGVTNASVPKGGNPEEVDLQTATELLAARAARGRGGRKRRAAKAKTRAPTGSRRARKGATGRKPVAGPPRSGRRKPAAGSGRSPPTD